MNELQRLIASDGAFTPPSRLLDAIPNEISAVRPAGVPHSIIEELWHIVYWLDFFRPAARCEPSSYPVSSREGWRDFDTPSGQEWDSLRTRFAAAIEETCCLAAGPIEVLSRRETTLVEPGRPPLNLCELLSSVAVHNAYHFGRIVQMRQMLGIWPPAGGGDLW